jgi:hypothetical protein
MKLVPKLKRTLAPPSVTYSTHTTQVIQGSQGTPAPKLIPGLVGGRSMLNFYTGAGEDNYFADGDPQLQPTSCWAPHMGGTGRLSQAKLASATGF